jgi:copper chaperone
MSAQETILIEGMSCGHCVKAVTKALQQVAGVETVEVSLGKANVRFDNAKASKASLVEAVEQAGYSAST